MNPKTTEYLDPVALLAWLGAAHDGGDLSRTEYDRLHHRIYAELRDGVLAVEVLRVPHLRGPSDLGTGAANPDAIIVPDEGGER